MSNDDPWSPPSAPQTPPPPPEAVTPPPPPGSWSPLPAAPPPPTGYAAFTANQADHHSGPPPRPRVPVAGALLVIGAAAMVVGCALKWVESSLGSFSGFQNWVIARDGDLYQRGSSTTVVVVLAVVLAALGVACLVAGRHLAVAIIGIVASALAALFALGIIGLLGESKDPVTGGDLSMGPGPVVVMIGTLVCLAGAITATAKRRVWR